MITEKKSQMTQQTTIGLVLLVLSFVIILVIWYQFNFSANTSKTACHTSVILRATASSETLKAEFRDAIPLQCRTDRICLVSGITSPGCGSLGKNYQRITAGSREAIIDAIAENLYSWHTTLGEGKINFMEREILKSNYCFIAAIMSLDDKNKGLIAETPVTFVDLLSALDKKKTDSGTSYLYEMYQIQKLDDIATQASAQNIAEKVASDLNKNINFSKDKAVIIQLRTPGKIWALLAGGGLTVGIPLAVAAIASAPVSVPVLLFSTAVGATTGGLTFWVTSPSPDTGFDYQPPQLADYDVDTLESYKCTSFETIA